MKFVKIIIDGKEYYRKAEDNEERADEKIGGEGEAADRVEIDAEINDDEVSDSEKLKRDAEQLFERMGNSAREFSERFSKGAREFGDKFAEGARELKDKIVSGTERLFNKDKSRDPASVDARLLKIMPYMSGEELNDICERLLADDKAFGELDLGAVMTFLDTPTCDKFFIKALELEWDAEELLSAVPFVSEECLTQVADDYVAGKYEGLEIDRFYPFMSDEAIKKIFYHIIGEKKE